MAYDPLGHENRITALESNNPAYTFAVRSQAAWDMWRLKTEGYDYRSILIDSPQSPLSVTSGINLTASGTRFITFSPGTVINVANLTGGAAPDAPAYLFKYDATQTNTGITGANILGLITSPTGAGYWSLFINCCAVKNASIALTSSQNSSLTAFQACQGIEDTTAATEAENSTLEQATYYQCQNLNNCGGVATGGISGSAFTGCKALSRCRGLGVSTTETYTNCVSVFGNPAANTADGGWNED
jgi:hypothetical protein